jgi:hypothetical protein
MKKSTVETGIFQCHGTASLFLPMRLDSNNLPEYDYYLNYWICSHYDGLHFYYNYHDPLNNPNWTGALFNDQTHYISVLEQRRAAGTLADYIPK